MALVHINDNSFETEVLKSSLPVCVDFWAEWCEPCRMLAPTIDKLAQEYCGKVKFCKLNIDQSPVTAVVHKVMSIPTVSIFKDGKEVKRLIGLRDKAELKHEIDSVIK